MLGNADTWAVSMIKSSLARKVLGEGACHMGGGESPELGFSAGPRSSPCPRWMPGPTGEVLKHLLHPKAGLCVACPQAYKCWDAPEDRRRPEGGCQFTGGAEV